MKQLANEGLELLSKSLSNQQLILYVTESTAVQWGLFSADLLTDCCTQGHGKKFGKTFNKHST